VGAFGLLDLFTLFTRNGGVSGSLVVNGDVAPYPIWLIAMHVLEEEEQIRSISSTSRPAYQPRI